MVSCVTARDPVANAGLLKRGRIVAGGVSQKSRDMALYLRKDFGNEFKLIIRGDKDMSFVPLRPELVVEVKYDQLQGDRLRHAGKRVNVNVLRLHEFQQTEAAVCPAVAALLHAAPGRLCDGVGVNNFVNHHCARVNPFGQALSTIQIAREDTRR